MRTMINHNHLSASPVSTYSYEDGAYTYTMHNVKETRKRSQASEMNTSNDNQNRFAGPYGPSVMVRVKKFANVLTRMAVGKNRWSQTKPGGSREEADSMACIRNVSVLRSWQLSREVCYWFGTVNHDLWVFKQCCGVDFWSHGPVVCVVFHVIQRTGISLGIEARDYHRAVKPVLRSTCKLRSHCSALVSRCLIWFGNSQLRIVMDMSIFWESAECLDEFLQCLLIRHIEALQSANWLDRTTGLGSDCNSCLTDHQPRR